MARHMPSPCSLSVCRCGYRFVSQDVHFVTDEYLWILYTDRQGCIQSNGFNFIRDLPTFFVLLYALQRLTLTEWGLNSAMDERVQKAHWGGLHNVKVSRTKEPEEWQAGIGSLLVTLVRNKLHCGLTMTGRGTLVVEGFGADAGQRRKLAVKIYWPETHRQREHMFIHDAVAAAKGDSDIINHLPTVISHHESYNTRYIRRSLGLEPGKPRLQLTIAFAYLEPITELSKEGFVRAWLDCVRCGCH